MKMLAMISLIDEYRHILRICARTTQQFVLHKQKKYEHMNAAALKWFAIYEIK